jgi:hypothetical protein
MKMMQPESHYFMMKPIDVSRFSQEGNQKGSTETGTRMTLS